ncbi:Ubiquitin carboxyl-terminal hydrolase 20-like protein [Dinothrombium tinctorium]|uniref:Ubiquitin carboxyl-terminal hydrolase n=1 Tax=Dinothrombium tinctorium TaxID=1965070 RepID=A0A443R6Q8_9ACAR|nr:Ubiquitin carboxyl-terminal hydrolase 20-like protein [Dinothrombium tinctorium]
MANAATSKCPHVTIVGNFTQEEIVLKTQKCNVCSKPGPNLWVCLHKDCKLFIGCGESNYDHSTAHFNQNVSHCLTLNLTTFRVWCYKCQTEVYLDRNDPPLESVASPPLSARIPILSNNVYVADPCENSSSSDDDIMDEQEKAALVNAEQLRSDTCNRSSVRSKGLTGLQNLGNTCYVNAALQALSNCPQLTRFMLDCSSYIRKGGLAKSYMRLIHEIWDSKRPSYVVPSGIVHGIKNVCPVFRGYTQHDAQEFLRCFLDQLHEELKETSNDQKEAYGDSDSNRDASEDESNSDADYETCDSGLSSERSAFGDDLCLGHIYEDDAGDRASTPSSQPSVSQTSPSGSSPLSSVRKADSAKKRPTSYRSIISDIFDGRILSSVQCLTCDNISTTKETFQDLSLPIPNRDHLHMLRAAASQTSKENSGVSLGTNASSSSYNPLSRASSTLSLSSNNVNLPSIYHWIWGWLEWVLSWLWGPAVSLQDCLSAFFSADELKGDNMYSCEKCKKLRNGIKFSKVLQLPEILCIHLKRFRHELLYSSKISSHVTFPLEGLDMAQFMARGQGTNNQVTIYDLVAVICHHGTVASGHYTTYALNTINETWYEFDDQYVTAVDPQQVMSCEAYVLFYRKVSDEALKKRQKALELMKLSKNEPSLLQFYVSKLWVNRFNTFAEPGPITNHDFLCEHGGVDPEKAGYVHELCTIFSRSVWEYLHALYGGGPTCTKLYICHTCTSEKESLDRRRKYEYETFSRLNNQFINQRTPTTVYSISMLWFKNWEAFVTKKTNEPPGPIDNTPIASVNCRSGQVTIKATSDHASLSEDMWNFLFGIYGGGPVIPHQSFRRLNSPQHYHHYSHHHSTQQQANVAQQQPPQETSKTASNHANNQTARNNEDEIIVFQQVSEASQEAHNASDDETSSTNANAIANTNL